MEVVYMKKAYFESTDGIFLSFDFLEACEKLETFKKRTGRKHAQIIERDTPEDFEGNYLSDLYE